MSVESRTALIGLRSAQRISGTTITYSRPGGASGSIEKVIPGDTLIEVFDEDGTSSKKKVRDYIIERTLLEAVLGAGGEPERGDQIVEVFAGLSRTHDVSELNGEDFRKWDKGGTAFRIHTIEIGTETTTTAGA